MNIMNDLHAVGLNPFAVVLLAESVLKSPIAKMSADEKPLTFFMPITRSDCAGWAGVEITIKAVRVAADPAQPDTPSEQSLAGPSPDHRVP